MSRRNWYNATNRIPSHRIVCFNNTIKIFLCRILVTLANQTEVMYLYRRLYLFEACEREAVEREEIHSCLCTCKASMIGSVRIPPCEQYTIARKGISIVNHWPTDSIDQLIDWFKARSKFASQRVRFHEMKIAKSTTTKANAWDSKKIALTWHSAGHRAVCCEQHSLSLSFGSANRLRGSFKRAIARDVCKSVFTSSCVVFKLFAKKLPRYPVYVCGWVSSISSSFRPRNIDQAILFGSHSSVCQRSKFAEI